MNARRNVFEKGIKLRDKLFHLEYQVADLELQRGGIIHISYMNINTNVMYTQCI